MTDDLVQFIRGRLDEDEAAAEAARRQIAERVCPPPEVDEWAARAGHWGVVPWLFSGRAEADLAQWGRVEVATVANDHIVRHDPARVLAEVDAKRRLLEVHGIVHRSIGWLEDGEEESSEIPVCGLCVPRHSHYQRREEVPEGPCLTLRLLALPYADHPDYRPEWRP